MKTHTKGSAAIWLLATTVAILLAVLCVVVLYSSATPASSSTNGRGGTSNADSIALGSNLNVGGFSILGTNGGSPGDTGYNLGYGRSEAFGGGNCIASTTAVAIDNPYNATSTFTIFSFNVLGTQPTSTSYIIGTSTKIAATASTDVSNVGGSFSVGSSTVGYYTPGAPGQNPTTGTLGSRTFAVGPFENVLVYATSTATGGGAGSYNNALNSCVIKGVWSN